MADFNIRSESVDVEQIMTQIRSRIREKRGVDYTEDQIRELAAVRLEKFLDPKNLRSDLLEQFRRSRPAIVADPPPVEPPYVFSDQTIYETHRGALRFVRKLLHPLLKLLFNPNPLITALHKQVEFNVDLLKREQRRKIEFDRSRADWNALYYEVLHNLVLETTRNGIELKNMKMRLEALASRLDFSERRVRALEGVVQYRPEAVRPRASTPREPQGRPEPGRAPTPSGRPEHVEGRDRDRDRDRDRGRERQPRQDTEVTGAEVSEATTNLAAETVDAEARSASSAGLDAGAAPVGPAGAGDPGTRRRRRRRRGRRGTSMAPAGVAGAPDQNAASDSANPGDDGFDDGDDTPEADLAGTTGPIETNEPRPDTPDDPDQQ